MTVAAVILAATPAAALADAAGTPAVRRMADAAWAGGATPVVVVAADPDGAVSTVLATAETTLLAPANPDGGPAAQAAHGIDGAARLVAATSAALVWPARFAWGDAETVTTLIEAHGDDPAAILRPAYAGRPGWPVLLPLGIASGLGAIDPARQPEGIVEDLASGGARLRLVETGDPGATHDVSVPRSALPPFDGPPRPEDDVDREWGAPGSDQPDDAPPAGPLRAAGDPVR